MALTDNSNQDNGLQAGEQNSHTTHINIDTALHKAAVPGNEFITHSEITRDGQDLVLHAPNGETIVIEGYFLADLAPMIVSDDARLYAHIGRSNKARIRSNTCFRHLFRNFLTKDCLLPTATMR